MARTDLRTRGVGDIETVASCECSSHDTNDKRNVTPLNSSMYSCWAMLLYCWCRDRNMVLFSKHCPELPALALQHSPCSLMIRNERGIIADLSRLQATGPFTLHGTKEPSEFSEDVAEAHLLVQGHHHLNHQQLIARHIGVVHPFDARALRIVSLERVL
jgi:hypothetical protein